MCEATLEQQAAAVGASRTLLRKRLREARGCLRTEFRRAFNPGMFDYVGKQLISDDGRLALRWQIRRHPDEPVSYENQQTNCGTVGLFRRERSDNAELD